MFKHSSVLIMVLLLFFLLPASSSAAENNAAVGSDQTAVAAINDAEITRDELYQAMKEDVGLSYLDRLIQKELVRQKQEQLGLALDESFVQQEYDDFITNMGGEYALEQFLFQNHLTREQFRDMFEFNLLVTELAFLDTEVSDAEIKDWFAQFGHELDTDEQVEVSHILVDTEEEANEIIAQLDAGASFQELARELSEDPSTAETDGYIGFYTRGVMDTAIEEVAFSLQPGEYDVAFSEWGWHILLVESRQDAVIADLDDPAAYEEIRSKLLVSKIEGPTEYIERLRSEADISIYIDVED